MAGHLIINKIGEPIGPPIKLNTQSITYYNKKVVLGSGGFK